MKKLQVITLLVLFAFLVNVVTSYSQTTTNQQKAGKVQVSKTDNLKCTCGKDCCKDGKCVCGPECKCQEGGSCTCSNNCCSGSCDHKNSKGCCTTKSKTKK